MRVLSLLRIISGLLLISSPAWAKKGGFAENQKGVSLGGGSYFAFFDRDKDWDLVPDLAPTGTDVSGSGKQRLIPIRAGFFMQRNNAYIEPYLRYVASRGTAWSSSGTLDGEGTTSFRSMGFGANLGVAVYRDDNFQLLVVGQGEYVSQRVTLSFESEELLAGNTSLLAGGGIRPEVWMTDQWSAGLFMGYLSSVVSPWSARAAGSLMGVSYAAGPLDDAAGDPVQSEWGGFLLELTLRLSFY